MRDDVRARERERRASPPGSAGRSRSRSPIRPSGVSKTGSSSPGDDEAVDAEERQVRLAVRADQPVRPDEHGGVVERVAVALEQPADDVDAEPARTRARAPRSTGPGSPRRTAAPPRRCRTCSPGIAHSGSTSSSRAGGGGLLEAREAGLEVALLLAELRLDLRHGDAHLAASLIRLTLADDEGSLLLRRRLPVLVPGVARGRGGRGRGRGRGRVAAVRAAARAEAAARAARRPPARRLDAERLPARARARDRDPPAALPAALDAAARRLPLGGRAGPAARRSSTRSTRRSSARARTSRPTREIARAAERAGLDPDGAVAAAYSPERFARHPRDPRGGRGGGRPRRAVAARPRTARRTGAWAASSGCSPASRSSPASTLSRARGRRSCGLGSRPSLRISSVPRGTAPRRGSGRASRRPPDRDEPPAAARRTRAARVTTPAGRVGRASSIEPRQLLAPARAVMRVRSNRAIPATSPRRAGSRSGRDHLLLDADAGGDARARTRAAPSPSPGARSRSSRRPSPGRRTAAPRARRRSPCRSRRRRRPR